MYQIKINEYNQIITDDPSLDIGTYYLFIDNVNKIYYSKDNGFILEYNNKQYFIRFTEDEIKLFEKKLYELLPYRYQKLIRKYHLKNEIIETNDEKREYLNKLISDEPSFKKIFINNYSKTIKKIITDKNIILLSLGGVIFFKELFKSIKEYKIKKNNWKQKIKEIEKLEVHEFAFLADKHININYILENMVNKKNTSNKQNYYKNNVISLYQYSQDKCNLEKMTIDNERKNNPYFKEYKDDKIISFEEAKRLIKKR